MRIRKSLLLAPLLCSGLLTAADSAPLPLLTYQGRLVEDMLSVSGQRNFSFAIVTASGVVLWQSGTLKLQVRSGLYSVVLGNDPMPPIPTSLLTIADLRLRITVAGVTLSPDISLVPSLQARSAWESINVTGPFAGDVSGTQNAIVVGGLLGRPLNPSPAPLVGQALVFDGQSWSPTTLAGSSGSLPDSSVSTAKLADNAVTNVKILSVAWGKLSGIPTNLAGYGITDGVRNSGGTPSILADVLANRPAFGSVGRLFVATDTKCLYRDTGSAWDQIAGTVITDGSIGTAALANGAVTNSKITSVSWGKITGIPTTLSGVGITDGVQNTTGVPSISAGSEAAMPAFGVTGRLYIATDTKKIWRDTGSAWDYLGTNTATITDGSVTAAKLAVGAVDLSSTIVTGIAPITKGGTGASDAATARTNLGIGNVVNLKTNLAAAVAPVVTDDGAAGYAVGSLWIDTTADQAWTCVDASNGAAVWKRASLSDVVAAGSYTKVTVDAQGRVTAGTTLVAADIPALDSAKITSGTLDAARIPNLDAAKITTSEIPIARGGTGASDAATARTNLGIGNIVNLKTNLTAAVAPVVTDDGAAGYAVGSLWVDTTADQAWTCVDASNGAAVWKRASLSDVVAAGSYTKVTVDAQGRVTAGTTLVAADIPSLDSAKITSGTLDAARIPNLDAAKITTSEIPIARGGTGASDAATARTNLGIGNIVNLKTNLSAAVAPVVTDDGAAGYAVGSLWVDTTADQAWTCVDSSNGAAVWKRASLSDVVAAGSYTKVTVDAQGRVTAGTTLVAADIPSLDSAKITSGTLDAARIPNLDAAKITTGQIPVTRGGTGASDASTARTNLGIGNVVNLKTNLAAAVAPVVTDDSAVGYAVGSLWVDTTADQAWTCVDSSNGAAVWKRASLSDVVAAGSYTKVTVDAQGRVTAGTTLVAADIPALDSAKITSGTLDAARIPNLDAAKITTSEIPIARGGTGASDAATARTNLGIGNIVNLKTNLSAAVAPVVTDDGTAGYAVGSLWVDTTADQAWTCVDSSNGAAVWKRASLSDVVAAGSYTKVTVDAQGRVTAGTTLVAADIPSLDSAKITSGTLDAARIPNLDAAKITTSEIPIARGGTGASDAATARSNLGIGNIVNLKTNLSAAVAPVVTDDGAAGYAVGSIWVDTTADKAYTCLDASNGAAVWKETTALAGVGGSGTVNNLPRLTAASTLGDSSVSDNGTSVSIGRTTASTTKDTGALIVEGGIGVEGAGYFGSTLSSPLFRGVQANVEETGPAQVAAVVTDTDNPTRGGSIELQGRGTLSWGFHNPTIVFKNSAGVMTNLIREVGGKICIGGGDLTYYDSTGISVAADRTVGLFLNNGVATLKAEQSLVTVEGDVKINLTTAATSKDTGAMIVEGGIGIEKDIFSGGDVVAATVGKGIKIKEGANAKMGTATLNGTTAVTITTSAVTVNSRIFLTIQAPSGSVGAPYVFTRIAATSFDVKSTDAADASTVAWMIIEPAP